MSSIEVIPGLSAATYRRHALHGEDQVWVDKNCYVDLWIELLHVLNLEPLAVLPCVISVDFEGDQWTFFKPSLEDLRELYGLDVQELTVWRPLIEHAVEHLGAGKLISTEADAFWLPDTVGTDYRLKHSKTTILLSSLSVAERKLGYFHNAAFFELSGDDFAGLFRLESAFDPQFLPLYAEVIRLDRIVRTPLPELASRSFAMLRRHFDRRPQTNPFDRFGKRIATDLPGLQAAGLTHYHAWAFASTRQAGSAFELAAASLRWLAGFGHPGLVEVAACFDTISQGNKALILKGARAVNSGRPLDASPLLSDMARSWERGMALLASCLSSTRD